MSDNIFTDIRLNLYIMRYIYRRRPSSPSIRTRRALSPDVPVPSAAVRRRVEDKVPERKKEIVRFIYIFII